MGECGGVGTGRRTGVEVATYYPLTPRTQATGYIDTDNIGLKDDDDTACSHEMK